MPGAWARPLKLSCLAVQKGSLERAREGTGISDARLPFEVTPTCIKGQQWKRLLMLPKSNSPDNYGERAGSLVEAKSDRPSRVAIGQ